MEVTAPQAGKPRAAFCAVLHCHNKDAALPQQK
jgi:hypothetical protein